jgi:hypothetical protein
MCLCIYKFMLHINDDFQKVYNGPVLILNKSWAKSFGDNGQIVNLGI